MGIPTKLPEWDTTQVNIVEVDQQHKDEGWLAPAGVPEKPPFQSFNWWQNLVYQWILRFKNITGGLNNVTELLALNEKVDGTSVNVRGYATINDGGGGTFNYDSTIDKSTANGGTIIDPDQTLANQGNGVGNGCWVRQTINEEVADVKWFGAIGDGTTDDTAAIEKVKLLGTPIRFTKGTYLLSTIDLFKPMIFEAGAKLKAASAETVRIHETIDSPKQFIFDGDGTYQIGTAGSPEARNVHVSWFNVFPDEVSQSDVSPQMQKMFTSLGTSREALVEFDVGTYYMYSGVTTNRAIKLIGAGDRLTSIWVKFASGDVFTTGGVGCNFHGLQFNADAIRTSGAYIRFDHERCEAYDIYMDKAFVGIQMNAFECEAHRIKGLTSSSVTDSAIVDVRADGCLVKTANYTSNSTHAPENVVRVGATINISNIRVYDVYLKTNSTNSTAVGIISNSSATVVDVVIDGVVLDSGKEAVLVLNKGANSPQNYIINNIACNETCVNGVRLRNESTGAMFGIEVSNITVRGATDYAMLIRNAGTGIIRNFVIGQHDLRGRKGLFIQETSGGIENVTINNGFARNCTEEGYNITAEYVTMSNCITSSNTSHGVLLNAGTTNLIFTGNIVRDTFTDNTGAITKVIANNIGA